MTATTTYKSFQGFVLFHFPPMAAESFLPRAHSGQVEAFGEPTEVDVHREVDAHASVAKFSPTASVEAISFFDQRLSTD